MTETASGVRRVAFFGGSFDPPHLGHLAVARAARTALMLDMVLFAPVGVQPLKPEGPTASFEDRLEMTRLAIAGEAGFRVSLADAPKPGGAPNFTLETLELLRGEWGRESALFCLVGADSYFGLRQWHRAAEIPFAAPLIVASRPGERMDRLKAALPEGLAMEAAPEGEREVGGVALREFVVRNGSGSCAPLYVLPDLDVEISASEIRGRMEAEAHAGADGAVGKALLPEGVAEYVRGRGLYR
jgi:nicotinate-nucleotide adenylyltransferase